MMFYTSALPTLGLFTYSSRIAFFVGALIALVLMVVCIIVDDTAFWRVLATFACYVILCACFSCPIDAHPHAQLSGPQLSPRDG